MTDTSQIILYLGGIYLSYLVLKSWGIISKSYTQTPSQQTLNWTPLTQGQLINIRNIINQ